VLTGLPGTGKSGIAEGLAAARGLPVLSVDPIESAIVASGIPRTFETGLAAYQVAHDLADAMLAAGITPVIDAVNSVEPARDMWRSLARRRDAALVIIECCLSDRAAHAARVAERDRGLAIPEPSWQSVVDRGAEWAPWPEPHLTLDATERLADNVRRAVAFVDAGGPPS